MMFLNYLLLTKMVKVMIIELAILNGNINHKLSTAKILNKTLFVSRQKDIRYGSEQIVIVLNQMVPVDFIWIKLTIGDH